MFYIYITKEVEIWNEEMLAYWLLKSEDVIENITEIEIKHDQIIRHTVGSFVCTTKDNIPYLIVNYDLDNLDEMSVLIPLDEISFMEYIEHDTLIRVILKQPYKECCKEIIKTYE